MRPIPLNTFRSRKPSDNEAVGESLLPSWNENQFLPTSPSTIDMEPFRSIFLSLESGVDQDELILQLRAEAVRLLPCDKVCLTLSGDGLTQIFERLDGHQSTLISAGERTAMWTPPKARLVQEDEADSLRCLSGVQAPFKIGGAFGGTVSFLANLPRSFDQSHTVLAQRIADSIGLILAKARSAQQDPHFISHREADWKDRLVRTLCENADIHRTLPEISSLLQSAIVHDRLSISYHDKDRYVSLRSVSNNDGPAFDRFQLSTRDCPHDGTSLIINDLVTHHPLMEPKHFHDKVLDAGYKSFLVTHVWSGQHGLGMVFWSKHLHAFDRGDVVLAQRIADLYAVAASREGLTPRIGKMEMGYQLDEPRRVLAKENARPSPPKPCSTAWNKVVQSASQVAPTDTTVLLVGDTGTGKEVVARLIYDESARKNGPFVAVNCAALPDTLLESELFGFERGAFTGAYHHKRGQIELASRGVLFLDEISEMSLSAQAKLLRVLETREFQPLGSARVQKADIRVIAATNRDLRAEIREGRFRADLFYRLCVFEIALPPLRSRKEDIMPLAYKFLGELKNPPAAKLFEISDRAEDALQAYHWPGNVRELRNVIERAAILCDGGIVDIENLTFQMAHDNFTVNELSVVERKMIEHALRECGGNKARAARMLGLSRTQLYVRLRRHFDSSQPWATKGVGV